MKVGQFPVEAVLVEEKIDIDREFFLSFAIDDAARAPMIIFAGGGGTGIEKRASATRRIPCDVNRGPLDSAVDEAVASCGLSPNNAKQLNESIRKSFAAARSVEARSLEINPLVLTKSGEFVAADCRITIDDYAAPDARSWKLKLHVSRSSADGSRAGRLCRRTKRSSRHILFRTVGNSGTERIQGTGRISRRRRRRLDDVDGRDRNAGSPSPISLTRAAIHLHPKYIAPRESFWPSRIWWVISGPGPALPARNNIGPPMDWPKRFGNSIWRFLL